jgi:AcrR family transcriptional regulator
VIAPQGNEGSVGDAASAEKRQRILRAALEVCAHRGVVAARMEEIAARAEVSKGTLYRFFESKEDLLLATIFESYTHGLRLVDFELQAAADPRQLLERLCEGLVGVLAHLGANARVHYQAWGIVAGAPAHEAKLLSFLRDFHAQRHAEMEAIVRAGQAAGVFRADTPPSVVADAMGSMLSGFIYRATFDPRAASQTALRACFDALIRRYLDIGQADPAGAAARE